MRETDVQRTRGSADEHSQAMRISSREFNDRASDPERRADWQPRDPADFSGVLLELARVQRGFVFYEETDARRHPLADRAHRALLSELHRAGPLEITLEPDLFRLSGCPEPIAATGALAGLRQAFETHGLRKLRIEPSLTRTALVGFLDLLGRESDRFPSPEHFARTLAARDTRGLCLNDIDTRSTRPTPKLRATPPHASVSLGSNLLTRPIADDPPWSAEEPKPALEDAPLVAHSTDDRGERLRARLIELDATIDDDEYRGRVEDIVAWSEELAGEGLADECFRAMLVLADHAVGRGGRSECQARAAAASFACLATGDRLEDLIDRAIRPSEPAGSGIRAAQLLLQLGRNAVPAILDRLASEPDPERGGPLRALLLTQGETALPDLLAAIASDDEQRSRIGIRLAGEIQNPIVLPALLETLKAPELSRRLETIRALSFLPGEASKNALTQALGSDLEAIASAAGEALATTDASDALPALLDVLEASLHTHRTQLGRTLVEVLGRIGDERAVPRLSAILERRPLLRRAHWHAIQIAAIDALSILPTKEARRSIERASLHAPRPIRDRAIRVLEALRDGRPRGSLKETDAS